MLITILTLEAYKLINFYNTSVHHYSCVVWGTKSTGIKMQIHFSDIVYLWLFVLFYHVGESSHYNFGHKLFLIGILSPLVKPL